MEQISGFGGVSTLAHLGGALMGFACWLLCRREQQEL
jgi:membrane associated rhomboid family serine protease